MPQAGMQVIPHRERHKIKRRRCTYRVQGWSKSRSFFLQSWFCRLSPRYPSWRLLGRYELLAWDLKRKKNLDFGGLHLFLPWPMFLLNPTLWVSAHRFEQVTLAGELGQEIIFISHHNFMTLKFIVKGTLSACLFYLANSTFF